MRLVDVMDELGDALETIDGLGGRTFRYPVSTFTPPAAIVGYPDEIRYDMTYGRGHDFMTIPVLVVMGRVSDRAARTAIAAYADGSGGGSVVEAVDNHDYSAFHTAHVTTAEFDMINVGEVDYVAALFEIEITGPGTI